MFSSPKYPPLKNSDVPLPPESYLYPPVSYIDAFVYKANFFELSPVLYVLESFTELNEPIVYLILPPFSNPLGDVKLIDPANDDTPLVDVPTPL